MDRFKFVPGGKSFGDSLGNDPVRTKKIGDLIAGSLPTYLSTPKSSEGLIKALNMINDGIEGGLTEGELIQATFKIGGVVSFMASKIKEMSGEVV